LFGKTSNEGIIFSFSNTGELCIFHIKKKRRVKNPYNTPTPTSLGTDRQIHAFLTQETTMTNKNTTTKKHPIKTTQICIFSTTWSAWKIVLLVQLDRNWRNFLMNKS